jgi:Protein of unknown function (DUF982)
MERGWFDKPVSVVFPGKPGVTYNVSSVFQAVDILLNKWPIEWGPAHLEARQACMAAMEGTITPGEARDAFITAAEEAGILVR